MKKIIRKDTVYYINDHVAEAFNTDDVGELRLLRLSDFVVKGNELIKCRHDLNTVVEVYMEYKSVYA